jgi:hypothetical protein
MSRNEAGYGDEDRLPWLETVEEDYREGPSMARIVLLVVLLLLVIAAGLGGYFWYQKQQGLTGNGQLINAQEGDYKVKPDEAGGKVVEGEGDSVFATSQGTASNASINLGATPEAPVVGQAASKPAPDDGSKNAKMPVPVKAGAGAIAQLGAFPDERGANTAWQQLSKRYAYLAPLGKSIERAEKDGKAIFRLRVNAGSNGQAKEICAKLKAAGENCYVAN